MPSLRIVADKNIPCLEEAFGHMGMIEAKSGHDIGPADVRGADVLLVRSVTPVDADLLDDSSIQFVGSATIGLDHIDQAFLKERDIMFAHAPGSNADSVADYVVAALLSLTHCKRTQLEGKSVGVVGCGHIGGRVSRRLAALGLTVLRNDPPRAETAEREDVAHDFLPLESLLRSVDILTLHVPLTSGGPHPTHHLIGAEELRQLNEDTWLLNTSRGAIVDSTALRAALQEGNLGAAALDVWEGEPTPDPDLIRAVDIATPHIAGYAYDGKVRRTAMLHDALCEHLGVAPSWTPEAVLQPSTPDDLQCIPPDPRLPRIDWLHQLAHQTYNLRADVQRMREHLNESPDERGEAFRRLRQTYPRRREMGQYIVPGGTVPEAERPAVAEGLTMQMS